MNSLHVAYINALLADASYVLDIKKGEIPSSDDRFKVRLTQTQADYLAANFTVLDSVETPRALGSGFDALVWQTKPGSELAGASNENAGTIFVSLRGTQGAQDVADDITLAARGIPYEQIRDMVNWWLKATAAPGEVVKQIPVSDSRSIAAEPIARITSVEGAPVPATGELHGRDNALTAVRGTEPGSVVDDILNADVLALPGGADLAACADRLHGGASDDEPRHGGARRGVVDGSAWMRQWPCPKEGVRWAA